MSRLVLPMLIALVAGCARYDSVDQACKNSIGGASQASNDAVDYFQRVNCYRRYAGLYRVRVQPDIQQGVEAHVAYMDLHFDPTPPWNSLLVMQEDPSKEGFTGATDYERTNNSMISGVGHGAWFHPSTRIPLGRDAQGWAEVVDEEMDHFVFRKKILQPSSWGVGLAASNMWRYSFELYRFPADERTERPIVYPVDGQVDVPRSTFNPWEMEDYIVPFGTQGHHITITVGSTSGGSWQAANPYGLTASDVLLVDDSGEPVPTWVLLPDSVTPGLMRYTVAVVPKEVLEPNSTYTFTAKVEWSDRSREVQSTFTTGSAE